MATELYDWIILDSVRTSPLRPSGTWCGRVVTGLINTASLTTRVLRRTFSHRQLARQPPPIDVNLECYYCGTVHPKLQLHVYEACPSYFLQQFVLFIQCVLESNLPLAGDVLDGQLYIPVAGPYALRYL